MQPKREPRPKKPKPEKKQDDSDEFVMLEDSSDEEFDVAMADNPKDEDFQLDVSLQHISAVLLLPPCQFVVLW